MAEKAADGGHGNAFGVEAGCVGMAEAVRGSGGRAGEIAEGVQAALERAGAEGDEGRGEGHILAIDGGGDRQLEAARNRDGAPTLGFRGIDSEIAGGEGGGMKGEGFTEATAAVGHEAEGETEGGVTGSDGEDLVEVGVVKPALCALLLRGRSHQGLSPRGS